MGKHPFRNDQIVVAVESFVMQMSPLLGDDFYCTRGMRLRGDHPAVVRLPTFFLADGADSMEQAARRNEILSERDRKTEKIEADRKAEAIKAQPGVIPYEDRVICIKAAGAIGGKVASARLDGQPLGALVGEQASRHWQIVRANRDRFVDVVPKGLKPEDAVVAREDLLVYDHGVVARKVWRGQWVSVHDPLVAIHGDGMFDRAPREPIAASGYVHE